MSPDEKLQQARQRIRVNSLYRVWWATEKPNNYATVLAVEPYTGRYQEFFDCVLRLTSPRTYKGYTEMACNSAEAWLHQPSRRRAVRALKPTKTDL